MNAAAITATIGGDVAPLRAAGDEAVNVGSEIAGRIAKQFEFRDIGRTLATSLGLNLESLSEKVASFVTGVSKQDEENYKKLGELSTQLADTEIANARAKLSDQDKYTLALEDQARLQAQIDANVYSALDKQVQKKQDQLALDNSMKASAELKAKIDDADAKQVTDDLAKQQKLVDDLSAAWAKYDAEVAQRQKQVASDVDKSISLQDRITEQKNAQLPLEDQLVAAEKQKAELIATQNTTVKGSNDYLELQIQINDKTNDIKTLGLQITEKTAAAAKEVAKNVAQGKTAADDFVDSMTKLFAEMENVSTAFDGFKTGFSSTGRANADLSDRELQAKIAGTSKDIDARKASRLFEGADVGNEANGWDGGNFDPFLNIQNTNLQGALAELSLRQKVRQQASILGADAAANNFGLTDSQLASILGTASDNSKIVDQLQELNTSLKNGTARVSNIPLSS